MTATKPITFDQLVRRMPAIVQRAYDPLGHLTRWDLANLAQFELDLHDEGEQRLTARQLASLKSYIALCHE